MRVGVLGTDELGVQYSYCRRKHFVLYMVVTYDEIYNRGLKVMDLTATTMCKENNLPIIVFDMDTVGNLVKVVSGEKIGTYVHN